MTHQPPVPEAATSPYPLHPAPIPEEVKAQHAREEAEAAAAAAAEAEKPAISPAAIGVGAAIGIGAAAVSGLLYARRRSRTAASGRKSGDNKGKRGKADRSRVAASEPYEVRYFARKHKISAEEARAIIKQAGPDREAANALARRKKH